MRGVLEKLPKDRKHALPVATAPSREAAMSIVLKHAKLGYDGIYIWQDFDGNPESLSKIGDTIAVELENIQ